MAIKKIIQIVPRLPPTIDGVGDYALNLARQLRQDFNVQTHFIVGNATWQGASEIEGFPVNQVKGSSCKHLVELLEGDRYSPVLLHYVGYGYAKRGCPVWLVDGLQKWKNINPQRSIVTMFHEIYASSDRPWESSFWLSRLQRNLAIRLAQMSDRALTSCQIMADRLVEISRNQQLSVQVTPVFSNIGELNSPQKLNDRKKQLVVFGHPNSRLQVYEDAIRALQKVCRELQIERIYDVGVPINVNFKHNIEIPIVEVGKLPSDAISTLLESSLATFMKFPPSSLLAKSSVFASYCAHGILVCKFDADKKIANQLEVNKHYWLVSEHSRELNLELAQTIVDNAFEWYNDHNLASQVKVLLKSLYCFCENSNEYAEI